jgi:glucan phosphorylase
MFYEHREQTPREWMRRVKQSLTHISPAFDCRRMVHEYMTELYEPAHLGHLRMRQANYQLSHEKAHWNTRIREVWDRVRFVDSGRDRAYRLPVESPFRCAPRSTWPDWRRPMCAWKR